MDIVYNTTFDEDQWSDIPTMIYKNFDQTKFAECKPPCLRMDISWKLLRIISHYQYRGLKILFDPTVEVALSVRTISLVDLMSSIGGFLGLFLGVSVLQIFYIIDNSVMVAFKIIVQFFRR